MPARCPSNQRGDQRSFEFRYLGASVVLLAVMVLKLIHGEVVF